jgi:transposase
MWNCASRQRHDRRGLRYPSDLTDAEWGLIAPMIPPAKRGGRRRTVDLRAVVEGLLYLLETGCQWRHLPKDFPPKSTVWAYFDLWSYDGTLARIHEALYMALREAEGREASPSAAIIDSQTVKSAEKGGPARRKPAMTRARRPRASSAISWSTPSA